MGLYNRDYYRESDSSVTDIRTWLWTHQFIALSVFVFALNLIAAGEWVSTSLALEASTATKPWMWWRFVTYPFVHNSSNLLLMVLNLWVFHSVARQVEYVMGGKEFPIFCVIASIVGGLTWIASVAIQSPEALSQSSISTLGCTGLLAAVVMYLWVRDPLATVNAPVPMHAWIPCLMYTLIAFVSASWKLDRMVPAIETVAAGSTFGAIYALATTRFPNARLPVLLAFDRWRLKPQVRVYTGEEDEEEPDVALEREADRILEKVHAQGESSLSTTERKTLERYSRFMREKHR